MSYFLWGCGEFWHWSLSEVKGLNCIIPDTYNIDKESMIGKSIDKSIETGANQSIDIDWFL